jgi:hypothetical protein
MFDSYKHLVEGYETKTLVFVWPLIGRFSRRWSDATTNNLVNLIEVLYVD